MGDMEELAGRSGPGKRAAGGEAVAHVTRMQVGRPKSFIRAAKIETETDEFHQSRKDRD